MPTVLVIDENHGTLETIGRALRGAGFEVALASTGSEGLKLAQRRHFDLVIGDLRLPDTRAIADFVQLRPITSDASGIVTGRAVARLSPRVNQTIHAIERRHVESDLRVSLIAHDLGVSTEHLCRTLKRETGTTFVAMLRRTRVRAACRLLQTTTLSMKEIASRTGFSSASRFDRDFKTVCGVPPSEYRASHPARR